MEQWHHQAGSHSPAPRAAAVNKLKIVVRTKLRYACAECWKPINNIYWCFEFTELIGEPPVFFYWKRKDMVCSIQFQKLGTKTMRLKFFYAKHILLQNELVKVVHFSFIDILGIIFCHLLNAFSIFMAAGKVLLS